MESQGLQRKYALNQVEQLDAFLANVQGRAYRMAQIATGSKEDALDVVQDAMFKLVEKYSERPASEWQPLFYRILQSRINDWYRRTSVRSRYHSSLASASDEQHEDPIQNSKDPHGRSPDEQLQTLSSMEKLQTALEKLPLRQQQAFLLRAWEGMDIKQTAVAMSCAEGSVKTHYSRAIHSLRETLGDYWP